MNKAILRLALLASLWAAGHAQAAVITFDELPANSDGTSIADGYRGLEWSNWGVTNSTAGGYGPATVSQANVSFNSFGNPASFSSGVVFTVNSLYATAAWNDGSRVTFTGWVHGDVLQTRTVFPSAIAPTLYAFDWSDLDTFMVEVDGGTHHEADNYVGDGPFVAIDNITVNEAIAAVPEPATYAMLLVGLAALGAGAKRRKAASGTGT
jgi:hypothetical protein